MCLKDRKGLLWERLRDLSVSSRFDYFIDSSSWVAGLAIKGLALIHFPRINPSCQHRLYLFQVSEVSAAANEKKMLIALKTNEDYKSTTWIYRTSRNTLLSM